MITRQEFDLPSANFHRKFQIAHRAGLPREYFISCAVACAIAVFPFVKVDNRDVCFRAIESIEKYLNGEISQSVYMKNIENVFGIFDIVVSTISYAAASVTDISYLSAADAARHAEKAVKENRSNINIAEIVNQFVSWDHLLATRIVMAINPTPVFPTWKTKQKDSDLDMIKKVMALPEENKQKLFQYADTILSCDDLKDEFGFLMQDYIDKAGIT